MTSITVLVVDDYEPVRRFVCSMLEQRAEFQVIGQASDGLEAIHKAAELQPDLILLDIGLPKLNGIEVARRVRRLVPQVRILFMSQDSSSDVVQEALRSGGLGYVLSYMPKANYCPLLTRSLGTSGALSRSFPVKSFPASDEPQDSTRRVEIGERNHQGLGNRLILPMPAKHDCSIITAVTVIILSLTRCGPRRRPYSHLVPYGGTPIPA